MRGEEISYTDLAARHTSIPPSHIFTDYHMLRNTNAENKPNLHYYHFFAYLQKIRLDDFLFLPACLLLSEIRDF